MRTLQRRFVLLGCLVTLVLALAAPARAAYEPDLDTLQPGQTRTLSPTIPVNVVFVGFTKQQFSESAVRALLPASYKPAVRYPLSYGVEGRDLGLNYSFDYDFEYTDDDFENDFFRYLKRIGKVGEPTIFQQSYNEQEGTLDVSDSVLYIDAPSTEKWLSEHAPSDVDVEDDAYTVYFINWYGRDDFKFHIYTKLDNPDPDTGFSFGNDDQYKTIAWGGSSSRSWFYDFSAGPEVWGGNYNITDADLDGDTVPDYRIPPIWEYATGGYRNSSLLGEDMGRLARYVAINLLFTTSPLYDPLNTTPGLDGRKVVSVNMLQQDPSVDGREFVDAAYVRNQLRNLQPYYSWSVDLNETDPIDEGALRALEISAGVVEPTPEDCVTEYGTIDAAFFCYFDENRSRYIPEYNDTDYVIPLLAYNLNAESDALGIFLGSADNNYRDGTQTYIYAIDSPQIRDAGFGFSVTFVHEVGHHIGLSHPHDGLDATTGLDYGPTGEYFFAWVGDESSTIMHYINTQTSFGQFDRDNIYRWETAGYLNQSNELLAAILASPEASSVDREIRAADRYAGRALSAFDDWDYLSAARQAYRSYNYLREAADKLGVVVPQVERNMQLPIRTDVPKVIDPIYPPHIANPVR